MDKKCGILIICAAILFLCFVGTASARTWYVDEDGGADFTRIQDAITAASAGDTIIVRDGTYTENVDVDKPLTIQSENGPAHTIIRSANSSNHVFEVTADYVNITGFGVHGSKAGIIYLYYANYCYISNNKEGGISLQYSNNNHLTNNICSSYCKYGVKLSYSNNNSISNNTCRGNSYDGLHLSHSNNNSIFNNTCSNNRYPYFPRLSDGIVLWHSNNNSITNNICSNNRDGCGISIKFSNHNSISNNTCSYNDDGIYLSSSNNNSIANNICSNNYVGIDFNFLSNDNKLKSNVMVGNGIYIRGWSLCNYPHEIDESNTVNGKPVYYWKDVNWGRVPDGAAGQVILVNCTNVIVENQKLNNASIGIQIAFSSHITIKNNNCSNNMDDGIYLRDSNNNCISNNTCSYNRNGIRFDHSSNNSISNNTCSYCWYASGRYGYLRDSVGIYICEDSNNNCISNNICSENWYDGIYIWTSNNNSISDNICSENGHDGISLLYSPNSDVSNNTCLNNSNDGISLSESNENIVYCNNFINNAVNVDSSESTNIWNSTSKITYTYNGTTYANYLGNYWDDYTDVDANNDGIWDHPRSIDPDQDYHPLVALFENYFVLTPSIFET